jgi:predicted lipoprotein
MRKLIWLIGIAVAVGLGWRFPLLHVVPIAQAAREKADATFNPSAFAEKLWSERVLALLDHAVQANVLLPAIQVNAAAAKKNFARSFGVSETYTYFVAGKGRVLTVSEDEILLAVTAGATNAEVSLQAGLIFGNAVRDGTGLLSVNDFPDSQNFNGISEALNHIIETRVLPKLRETAKVGAVVKFAGCVEVNDESSDLKPLKVVPLRADVE